MMKITVAETFFGGFLISVSFIVDGSGEVCDGRQAVGVATAPHNNSRRSTSYAVLSNVAHALSKVFTTVNKNV